MIQRYRLVDSAKSVGIVCGQSIGEMQTQTTLNTFHKTGLTEKLVVAGVPRFLEIIDTNRSETQGTPSSYVYFKEPVPRTIADIRQIVGHSLVHFTLSGLISNWSIVETETQVYIRYTFKLDVLFRYKLHVQTIAEILLRAFPAYTVEASPLHLAYIDVYPGRQMEHAYEMEDVVHPQLLEVPICGIERIQNIFFMRAPDQSWYIETDGSNLEAVLNLAYVDSYRTYSNDIWEIYALFGIEAVRAYIIEELTALMPTIHPSHINLLADRMTVSGRLRSISRYTRKHEQSSVLSKATFEETLSGFLRSAIMNEVDTVNGSSASIICGKIPKVGSGMNDLVL
jgi:DNA-directed RNA polymerase subunit A"